MSCLIKCRKNLRKCCCTVLGATKGAACLGGRLLMAAGLPGLAMALLVLIFMGGGAVTSAMAEDGKAAKGVVGAAVIDEADAAAAPAPTERELEAQALIGRYFAESDENKRRELAVQFAKLNFEDWASLRRVLHRGAPFPDQQPGRQNLRASGLGTAPAADYILRIPANYDKRRADGWPLIIGCHGTGGSADGQMRLLESMLGDKVEDYVVVSAESPHRGLYKALPPQYEFPLAVLADVRRKVNINSDRTIITGYSNGGYTTWGMAMFAPGEWGGAAPMAAFPLTQAGVSVITLYLPNVTNLDIQSHWGQKDIVEGQSEGINTLNREVTRELSRMRAGRYQGIEYAGQGHQIDINKEQFQKFVAEARREPFPSKGKLIFHAVQQGRAWYATALKGTKEDFDFSQGLKISVTRPEDVGPAIRKKMLDEAMELNVTLQERTNIIRVVGRNVAEVEIVIPLAQMNWSRPMRVFFGRRQVSAGKRDIDWFEMLETARRTYDFERLIGGRVVAGEQ